MLVHKMLKQMLLFTEVKQTNKTEKKNKEKKSEYIFFFNKREGLLI